MHNTKEVLRDLFSARYFSFLMHIEEEISKINMHIDSQNSKKIELQEYYNKFEEYLTESRQYDFRQLFSEINNLISLFMAVRDLLYSIDQDSSRLVISLQAGTKDMASASISAQEISSRISSYQKKSLELEGKVLVNNIKISSAKFGETQKTYYAESYDSYSTMSTQHDNNVLLISSKENKVYLPYTEAEVNEFLNDYPDDYSSFDDVVEKEFIVPLTYYSEHSNIARFRETFLLLHQRDEKTLYTSLKSALKYMNNKDINPAIISACKNNLEFKKYLECLEDDNLNDFNWFEIKYETVPA